MLITSYDRDLPRTLTTIPDDPNHLPFYTPTQMFIRTIQCLSMRFKESDRQDLLYLHSKFSIDMAKVNRKVTVVQRDDALQHCGNNEKAAAILNSLAVHSYD